jgi:hypothetical protein
LLLMLALPVSSYWTGSTVGSYRMFTDLVHYHVELWRVGASGARQIIELAELAPHLGREARRIILPAAHRATGETAAELLVAGRQDLARLGCTLHPQARSVEIIVQRRALRGELRIDRSELRCGDTRP